MNKEQRRTEVKENSYDHWNTKMPLWMGFESHGFITGGGGLEIIHILYTLALLPVNPVHMRLQFVFVQALKSQIYSDVK